MTRLKVIRSVIFGGITQAEMGRLLGVSQKAINALEQRDAMPERHQRTIRKLAAERGIAWQDRWFFDPPKKLPNPVKPRATPPARDKSVPA